MLRIKIARRLFGCGGTKDGLVNIPVLDKGRYGRVCSINVQCSCYTTTQKPLIFTRYTCWPPSNALVQTIILFFDGEPEAKKFENCLENFRL